MNIYLRFLLVGVFSFSSSIHSMHSVNYQKYLDPRVDMDERIEIVDNYINNVAKNYLDRGERFPINASLYWEGNMVTEYLSKMPKEDIRIDNEMISYFFSQGLDFLGDKRTYRWPHGNDDIVKGTGYHINHFCYLLSIDKKEKVDDKCFFTKLCLYRKLEATDLAQIKKDICFLNLVFENAKTLKLPKNIFNIIISKYFINTFEGVKGITKALESKEWVNRSGESLIDKVFDKYNKKKAKNAVYAPFSDYLRYNLDKYQLDPNHYKFSLALLNPAQWKNNNVFLIKELVNFMREETEKITTEKD